MRITRVISLALAGMLGVGCDWQLAGEPDVIRDDSPDAGERAPSGGELSLLTWNVDWFGDRSEGPSDEESQYRGVLETLRSWPSTLIALEEVADEAAFDRLLGDLAGYAGALSGHAYRQRTALLWDRTRLELLRVRAISGLADAGRPPLEVELRDKHAGITLRVVVVHAKAQGDARSHQTRLELAHGLSSYLKRHCGPSTILLGDFNDLLSGSISPGEATPYADFTSDPAFSTPTLPLNEPHAAEASYLTGSTLDHIVLSAELGARVSPESVDVLRDELLVRDSAFGTHVSDHFPVRLKLEL